MDPMKRENTDCRRFKKRWGPKRSQTSLRRKIIPNLPIVPGVRNFKWPCISSSEHSKWPSISQVLCYSTPLQLFCWSESNRLLTSELIQIFNFGIFIYWDVDRKREQKRPYLNHLGKTYNCFCNALISSHRILGVLAEERYHRSFTDSTLHTGVFTVNH